MLFEAFGRVRLVGLVAAVIILDVAPVPGENYSRCGSEQTPLLELEIEADGTELPVGESMELEAMLFTQGPARA